MIEWGGWKFDELRDEMVSPSRVRFTRTEALAVGLLLRAEGCYVTKEQIIAVCNSQNVGAMYAMVGAIVRKLRAVALPCPEVKFNVGYAMRNALGYDPRERDVAAILMEELEATSPHATAVAARIGKLYRRKA